jgi:hypothetical protein
MTDYEGALDLLIRLDSEVSLAADNVALISIEKLFCDLMISPASVERSRVEAAEGLLSALSGDDESAIACRVLSDCFFAVGLTDKKLYYSRMSHEFSRRFLAWRADLAGKLTLVASSIDPVRT